MVGCRMVRCLIIVLGMLLTVQGAAAACNFEAHAPWVSAKAEGLMVNAYSVGEKCGYTAVVFTVTDKDGKVLWTLSRSAQEVSIFTSELGMSPKEVKEALQQWLEIGNEFQARTTKDLPEWPEGKEEPTREGEFGYYIDESMNRSYYVEQRDANRPLFCTVSGIESETCITYSGAGLVQEFGGFSFPG